MFPSYIYERFAEYTPFEETARYIGVILMLHTFALPSPGHLFVWLYHEKQYSVILSLRNDAGNHPTEKGS